jgi:hypothetical protein
MADPFDMKDLFEQFNPFGGGMPGSSPAAKAAEEKFRERLAAKKGECPPARACETVQELARWFENASLAAGAIARSGKKE